MGLKSYEGFKEGLGAEFWEPSKREALRATSEVPARTSSQIASSRRARASKAPVRPPGSDSLLLIISSVPQRQDQGRGLHLEAANHLHGLPAAKLSTTRLSTRPSVLVLVRFQAEPPRSTPQSSACRGRSWSQCSTPLPVQVYHVAAHCRWRTRQRPCRIGAESPVLSTQDDVACSSISQNIAGSMLRTPTHTDSPLSLACLLCVRRLGLSLSLVLACLLAGRVGSGMQAPFQAPLPLRIRATPLSVSCLVGVKPRVSPSPDYNPHFSASAGGRYPL